MHEDLIDLAVSVHVSFILDQWRFNLYNVRGSTEKAANMLHYTQIKLIYQGPISAVPHKNTYTYTSSSPTLPAFVYYTVHHIQNYF